MYCDMALYDNHGRLINYVRLAVTDRCNLRCFYCMPEEGIDYVPRQELMTFEEMEHLMRILSEMGIEKIRITGGEPFLRKGLMSFLYQLSKIERLQQINITSNGILTAPYLPELKKMGIQSMNLSLDTLDKDRFYKITRRNDLDKVLETLEQLLKYGFKTKINTVVMNGKNIEDIIPLIELTKEKPISVRFIEEMPFNGSGQHYQKLEWNYKKILSYIQKHFPAITKKEDPLFSTSANYAIKGHKGDFGIIAAYSRTFCGTCNRLRLTPLGLLKTCLYDKGIFNVKNMLRVGANNEQLKIAFYSALGNRAKNGFEAEKQRGLDFPISESMSSIGG